MDYLFKYTVKRKVKKKVNNILPEKNPSSGPSTREMIDDAWESTKEGVKNSIQWIKNLGKTDCQVPTCHQKSIKGEKYCSRHKCYRCSELRMRPGLYCLEHQSAYRKLR